MDLLNQYSLTNLSIIPKLSFTLMYVSYIVAQHAGPSPNVFDTVCYYGHNGPAMFGVLWSSE